MEGFFSENSGTLLTPDEEVEVTSKNIKNYVYLLSTYVPGSVMSLDIYFYLIISLKHNIPTPPFDIVSFYR